MIEPLPILKTGLEYRELTKDEVNSLAPIFTATGNPLPDLKVSTFVGAIENGKVIGFIVLQAKLHAEPMWIESGKSQIFPSLVKKTEEVVLQKCGPQWVYLFAPAGRVGQLAASSGMQMEPWNIYSKLIMPETPHRGPVELMPSDEDQPIALDLECMPTGEATQ